MEKEKKSHKGLIFIFILILMGGTFYLGLNFDKVKTTFNEKVLKKEKKPTKTGSTEDATLYEIEKAMEDANIEEYLAKYNSLDELTNQAILRFAAYEIAGRTEEIITAEDLREVLNKTILKNLEYKDEDIYLVDEDDERADINIKWYSYDSNTKTYELNDYAVTEIAPLVTTASTTYDFYCENNQYIIEKYNVYFGTYGGAPGPIDNGPFYGKYEDVGREKGIIFDVPYAEYSEDEKYYDIEWYENVKFIENLDDVLNSNLNEYKDKVTKTTYVFEKHDGQLVLVDYKKN